MWSEPGHCGLTRYFLSLARKTHGGVTGYPDVVTGSSSPMPREIGSDNEDCAYLTVDLAADDFDVTTERQPTIPMERKAATARYCVRRGSSAEQNAQREGRSGSSLFGGPTAFAWGMQGSVGDVGRRRQRWHWAHSKSPQEDRQRKLESRQDAHDRGAALA